MAAEDYAIVVGLQNYPALDNGQPSLSGPENDAKAFIAWLVSKDGGDVADDGIHIQKILSSDYKGPFNSLSEIRPWAADIETAFKKLKDISDNNFKANKPLRIGRRLYVFMAGHGMAPESVNVNEVPQKEAVLLTPNVERTNVGTSHVLSAYATSWFCNNTCFDEVFLFMDCCRENALLMGRNFFLPNTGTVNTGVRCSMFATKWSRLAREQMMNDENAVRGVFTKTLLLGLDGAAAEIVPGRNDGMGVITVASLRGYLIQHMQEFLPDALKQEAGSWDPDFDYFPDRNNGADIVIKEVPLPSFPVTITLPQGATGTVSILYDGDDLLDPIPVPDPLVPIALELPRGMYLAMVSVNGNSVKRRINVTGIEGRAGKGGLHVQI